MLSVFNTLCACTRVVSYQPRPPHHQLSMALAHTRGRTPHTARMRRVEPCAARFPCTGLRRMPCLRREHTTCSTNVAHAVLTKVSPRRVGCSVLGRDVGVVLRYSVHQLVA